MNKLLTTLILLLTTTIVFAQDITGQWTGEIGMNGHKLSFDFGISKSGGRYESRLAIPRQGVKDVKAAMTSFKDQQLTISFPEFQMRYEGTLTAQGTINGQMIQAGMGMPLELKKGTRSVNRSQKPAAPFNYRSEDISFQTADGLKLAGTLTLPQQEGKYPVVILISGSGPQNRDGDMFDHQPYYVLADHLSRNGIGVLRFDERGVGESEGSFESATVASHVADVTSALNYLKSRRDIKPAALGLIGHSIGGLVAPQLAAGNMEIDFIVLMAAPGVNGDQLMLAQKAAFERSMGLPELQVMQGQSLVKGAYDIIVNTSLEQQSLQDSINAFYIQKYGQLIPEVQRTGLVNQLTGNELIGLVRAQPATQLAKVRCRVLAINGSKDLQVLPGDNLNAIESVLKANGNKGVTVKELPGLNHLFQECTTGLTDEYGEIGQTMSPLALETISNWISGLDY